ncbi:hypothetical protein Ocin01_06789 [Orchesella cincta]|uniref:Uncharacterized protein n=1 Tax=Orchesella cincta TaxID=48709 RepID=A0A1D2N3P5_ORCCI|nr:hypothetical protein Ocin01_06789 [Orchesella cincta]
MQYTRQVSIVVADIDGPIPPDEETSAVQGEPQSVEQIQAEAERRRAEFAQLLEEHAELVTTVTKLERVATIVSKSCAEALAQQEQQPPPS